MIPLQWTAGILNHLWQSTIFAAAAWLLALALRKNHARVRYRLWMLASVKFLIPFSLLIAAGGYLRSTIATPISRPDLSAAMEQVAQPFPQTQATAFVAPSFAAPAVAEHHIHVWPCHPCRPVGMRRVAVGGPLVAAMAESARDCARGLSHCDSCRCSSAVVAVAA